MDLREVGDRAENVGRGCNRVKWKGEKKNPEDLLSPLTSVGPQMPWINRNNCT